MSGLRIPQPTSVGGVTIAAGDARWEKQASLPADVQAIGDARYEKSASLTVDVQAIADVRYARSLAAGAPGTSTSALAFTSLATVVLLAASLAVGDHLHIIAVWKKTGAAAAANGRVKFGATTVLDTTGVGVAADTRIFTETIVCVTGAALQDACNGILKHDGAGGAGPAVQMAKPTEAIANAITIDFAGIVGNAGDACILDYYSVFFVP